MDQLDSIKLHNSKFNSNLTDSIFKEVNQLYSDIYKEKCHRNISPPSRIYRQFINHITKLCEDSSFLKSLRILIVGQYLQSIEAKEGSELQSHIEKLTGIKYINDDELNDLKQELNDQIFYPFSQSWCQLNDTTEDQDNIEKKLIEYNLSIDPIYDDGLINYYSQ